MEQWNETLPDIPVILAFKLSLAAPKKVKTYLNSMLVGGLTVNKYLWPMIASSMCLL